MSTPIVAIGNRYEILLVGAFAVCDMRLDYNPRCTPLLDARQCDELARIVETRTRMGQRIDQDDRGHRPPLYRFLGYRIARCSSLAITVGKTDFAEYLLTNVEHPEWRTKYGETVMADALAISVATITSDEKLIWGRRSRRTADGLARFHVLPSGHPHPPQTIGDAILEELGQEVDVRSDEVLRTNAQV